MSEELTTQELEHALKMARAYCPGFGEQEFQAGLELQRRLLDEGYLAAVRGLARLEKEKGITCCDALQVYEQLAQDAAKLKEEVAGSESRLAALNEQIRLAEESYDEAKARTELAQKEQQDTERRKEQIKQEVEECRRRADITEEEVTAAGQLKAQLERRGFGIELLLDLCQEFRGRENARKELARVLEQHGSLTESVRVQESHLLKLQSEYEALKNACLAASSLLSQLQASVANQQEVMRFYSRYHPGVALMEEVATWRQVFFLTCNNPLCTLGHGRLHFWTDALGAKCPYCGSVLNYDKRLYQALNWPSGPCRLQLGE